MDRLPTDVLWVARYDYARGWRLRPHAHRFAQLILALSGSAAVTVGRTRGRLRAGELLLVLPGVRHGLVADRGPLRTLDLKFTLPAGALRVGLAGRPAVGPAPPGARARLEAILDEAQARRPHARAACAAHLHLLLLDLARAGAAGDGSAPRPAPPATPRDPRLARVVRVVQNRLADALTPADLAAAAGCSVRHLHTCLRRGLGETAAELVRRLRLERARALLGSAEFEIKQISAMTGFASVHHFTRVFAAAEGCPPARWQGRQRQALWQGVAVEPSFTNADITDRRPAKLFRARQKTRPAGQRRTPP